MPGVLLSVFSSNFQASLKLPPKHTVTQGANLLAQHSAGERKQNFCDPGSNALPPLRQVISDCFNFIHLATSETASPVPSLEVRLKA